MPIDNLLGQQNTQANSAFSNEALLKTAPVPQSNQTSGNTPTTQNGQVGFTTSEGLFVPKPLEENAPPIDQNGQALSTSGGGTTGTVGSGGVSGAGGISDLISQQEKGQIGSVNEQTSLAQQQIDNEFKSVLAQLGARQGIAGETQQLGLKEIEQGFGEAQRGIQTAVSQQLQQLKTERELSQQEAQRARSVVEQDATRAEELAKSLAEQAQKFVTESAALAKGEVTGEAARAREQTTTQARKNVKSLASQFNNALNTIQAQLSAAGISSSSASLAYSEQALRSVNQSIGSVLEAEQQGVLKIGEDERNQLEQLRINSENNLANIEQTKQQNLSNIASKLQSTVADIESTLNRNLAQVSNGIQAAQAFATQKISDLQSQRSLAEERVRTEFRNAVAQINADRTTAENAKANQRLAALQQANQNIADIRAQASQQRISLQQWVAEQQAIAGRSAQSFEQQKQLIREQANAELQVALQEAQLNPFQTQAIAAQNLGTVGEVAGQSLFGNLSTGGISQVGAGTQLTPEQQKLLQSGSGVYYQQPLGNDLSGLEGLLGGTGSTGTQQTNGTQPANVEAQSGASSFYNALQAGIPPLQITKLF